MLIKIAAMAAMAVGARAVAVGMVAVMVVVVMTGNGGAAAYPCVTCSGPSGGGGEASAMIDP